MLVFRPGQEIWPVGETAHHSVDVVLGYGLQDDTAELVFEKFDLGAGLDPVLATEFGRDHKLALRSKCSTHIIHGLHCTRCKTHPGWKKKKSAAKRDGNRTFCNLRMQCLQR